MSNPFKFKQFTVLQDRCAMKVGTDGVLLGAWCKINQANSVLDIGAGTGVIALMIAQRSIAETIDALEIDTEAFEQCVDNFETSLWGDRLFCYHASFEEFVDETEEQYDFIVSNPPFYSSSYKSKTAQRDMARFQDALPFETLIKGVSKLLSPKGTFATIIPFSEEYNFIKLAKTFNLIPFRKTCVKGTPSSEIKRTLLQFSFQNETLEYNELVIEISRHNYTKEYRELVKDFYLKM